MAFREFSVIPLLVLLAVLAIPPALAAGNLTDLLNTKNASVTNLTEDLQKDPGITYYNTAERSLVTGDNAGAIRLFDQALASNITMLNKTDALLYIYRDKAFAQIQLADYSGAVTTVESGLLRYPGDPILWNNKGWALLQLGRSQDALDAFDRAVALDGSYTNALLNRANLLNSMGRYSEAADAFILANASDPFNVNASDGLNAALNGEARARQTTLIAAGIILIAGFAGAVWYLRFRKPAGAASEKPAKEEEMAKSKKKK